MVLRPPSPVATPTKPETVPYVITPSTTKLAKPQQEYILDSRGDLWLHTRGIDASGSSNAGRFRVCSRTVARASPVFDKMLFGVFAEGSDNQAKDQEWVVELPDDPTAGMRALLEIAHSQYQRITSLRGIQLSTINHLYDLMVAADKYNCVALLRPWAGSWTVCQNIYANSSVMFRAAWVLYQLGHKRGYEAVVTRLVTQFPPSAYDFGFKIPILPPQLYENVRLLRSKLVNSLLDPVRANIESLVRGNSKPVGLCTEIQLSDQEKLACEAAMLGGLIRKLHDQNLWPLPDDGKATTPAAKIGASIKDLATKTETPAPPNPRSFVNSFGGHGSRHVHAGYRDVAPPNLGGFGNSIGSGRSSRVHAGCRGVTPPFETRAEAHDNPWVYSMDYHYQASREESAHMVRQAALSGVY